PPPPPVAADSMPESVFREVAAQQLDVQITTNDVLDTRNMTIVWVGSTVLPVTFTLLRIGQVHLPESSERTLKVSLVFYGLLLTASWCASLFRGISARPNLTDLQNNVQTQTYAPPAL